MTDLKPVILGLLRHVLTAGGGFLVASGYVDAAQAETIVGAVITLAGVFWSIADKRGR